MMIITNLAQINFYTLALTLHHVKRKLTKRAAIGPLRNDNSLNSFPHVLERIDGALSVRFLPVEAPVTASNPVFTHTEKPFSINFTQLGASRIIQSSPRSESICRAAGKKCKLVIDLTAGILLRGILKS